MRRLSLKEAGRVRRRLRVIRTGYTTDAALARALGLSAKTLRNVLKAERFAGFRVASALASLIGYPSPEALISARY